MIHFNRNHLAGLCFLIALSLSISPFRALIINDMFWHMDIQIPMLIATGVLLKLPRTLHFVTLTRANLYGLTSFLASQLILAFWMLPITIDKAIIHWQYDLAKIISLVICGLLIRLSFSKATLVIEIFFVGYFLSMMIWIGQYYVSSNERLCNVYSQDSQQFAGIGLIIIGVDLALIWALAKFISRERSR